MEDNVETAIDVSTTNTIDDDVPLSAGWRTVYRALFVEVGL